MIQLRQEAYDSLLHIAGCKKDVEALMIDVINANFPELSSRLQQGGDHLANVSTLFKELGSSLKKTKKGVAIANTLLKGIRKSTAAQITGYSTDTLQHPNKPGKQRKRVRLTSEEIDQLLIDDEEEEGVQVPLSLSSYLQCFPDRIKER